MQGDAYWKLLGKVLSSLIREGEARPQSEPLACGHRKQRVLIVIEKLQLGLRMSPGCPCSHTKAGGAGSRGPLGAASLEALISSRNAYAARASETGIRRAIALYRGPKATFIGAKDRIWRSARNWANYLAELVLIHCHHPRPITRLSWDQTGKLNGDALDHHSRIL
ncbi:uncharacterized protein LOC113909760 isoform X2 [Zalophus californianus]|nr:uncharacterized protein LOC113909760 isoform X2 [Zalophus californianus]